MDKKADVSVNESGVTAKRRNHTVPKALLKRWQVRVEGQAAFWVLDCNLWKVALQKGKDASFAISDYRYVPIRYSGEQIAYRDEALENWFAFGESDLASVTDKLLEDKLPSVKNKSLNGFVKASILLGFRSAYEFERVESLFKSGFPELTEEEVGARVVDHFVGLYWSKLQQFQNWDFKIIRELDEPLLLGDRPLFDMTVSRNHAQVIYIPLTPEVLLVAVPPAFVARKTMKLSFGVRSGNIAAKVNNLTVKFARQFIVGQHAQLMSVQDRLTSADFEARKSLDSYVLSGNGVEFDRFACCSLDDL